MIPIICAWAVSLAAGGIVLYAVLTEPNRRG
jgi:hypothetical protein